jgi:hypothetical protein
MSRAGRQLALAVASRRIGFAYLKGCELLHWGVARKASISIDAAFAQTAAWIGFYKPSTIIIEEIDGGTRKGKHTVSLIHTIEAAAIDRGVEVVAVPRRRHHRNKYVEAQALARSHTRLAPFVPRQRRAWDCEPHRMIIFEAVGLADEWCGRRQ